MSLILSEFESILAPLSSGPLGVGENTRYDGTYDKIKEARRFDDPTLPLGVWKKNLKKADYNLVETLCYQALTQKTKDFQIMAWLLEAWIILYGFPGFHKGIELMHGLVQNFWPEAFPRDMTLKEGHRDLEIQLSPFHWMNEKLPEKIIGAPLIPQDPYSSWSIWRNAHLKNRQQKSSTTPSPPIPLKDAPSEVYDTLNELLESSLTHLNHLSLLLANPAPSLPLSFYNLTSLLKEIQAFVQNTLLSRSAPPEVSIMPVSDQNLMEKPQEDPSPTFSSLPAPSSREEAYKQLALIAEYLSKTEPHSPGPYLIRRAISWSKLSLGEVFGEVLREQGDLNQLLTLLGIHPNQK